MSDNLEEFARQFKLRGEAARLLEAGLVKEIWLDSDRSITLRVQAADGLLSHSVAEEDIVSDAADLDSFIRRKEVAIGTDVIFETEEGPVEYELGTIERGLSGNAANGILDLWATILPQRIVDEEIGDYLEDINRRIAERQSAFKVRLRIAAAMFWTGTSAIGYITKNLLGKRQAS